MNHARASLNRDGITHAFFASNAGDTRLGPIYTYHDSL